MSYDTISVLWRQEVTRVIWCQEVSFGVKWCQKHLRCFWTHSGSNCFPYGQKIKERLVRFWPSDFISLCVVLGRTVVRIASLTGKNLQNVLCSFGHYIEDCISLCVVFERTVVRIASLTGKN